MKETSEVFSGPSSLQLPLTLDGYSAPHPDGTKAHLEMAYEFGREVIEQARIADRAKERFRELDLERYRARSLRKG